jgi:hypothetical protein
MSKSGKRPGSARAPAVSYTFAAGDSDLCVLIRRDVDDVLAEVSDHGIKSTTPNDHLLTHYIWPQDIQRLYGWLNSRLGKYSGYTPFAPDAFDDNSTVGDVREQSYAHCHATCSSI